MWDVRFGSRTRYPSWVAVAIGTGIGALGYFLVATADYNVARRLNFGKYRFRDS